MIYKEHLVELWVNGQKLELEDQKSLNMRFNNVLTDPTKISSTNAEYSFEFEVPATPHNNKIFDFANNLSKPNKFHQRYNAEVIADGSIIFSGSLTINSYKDKKYSLNLVQIKNYSLEDIFGDDTMNMISGTKQDQKWYIDFNGVETMNSLNASTNPDVTFPLISYGAFQKGDDTSASDSVAKSYTSKFDLDKWNKWYVESFPPSPKMLTTIRKCFEYKNYAVGGDVFDDDNLNKIYMSENLADGQDPTYNLANPRFGEVDLSVTLTTTGTGYQQELQFPYFRVSGLDRETVSQGVASVSDYNFTTVNLYDFLSNGTVTMTNPTRPSYMYRPNEHLIVIPADGFYKIEMETTSTLNTTSPFTATTHLVNIGNREMYDDDIQLTPSFNENTPLEIHLVRNYSDNIELIKGSQNIEYVDGNPNNSIYSDSTGWHSNIKQWMTCFPHEDPYNSDLPTKQNDMSLKNTSTQWGGNRATAGKSVDERSTMGGSRTNPSGARTRGGGTDTTEQREYARGDLGYVPRIGDLMCYDPAVTDTFICGVSSMHTGFPSVIKNGYSWSTSFADKMQSFYPQVGYMFVKRGTDGMEYEHTQKNYNTYANAPASTTNATDTTMNGKIACIVYLNKNDKIQLYGVQRAYANQSGDVTYSTTSTVHLKMTAFSPDDYDTVKAKGHDNYNTESQFDDRLRISNFFNQEKKISEWVQNIADAYNLDIIQNGTSVTINRRKKTTSDIITAVDIDDRVNSNEAESQMIDYPKSMAVKYKIDTEEWGAEKSVIDKYGQSKMNDTDWKNFIDSGYTEIMLNDDSYVTSKSEKSLQFSYTWYDNFYYFGNNERKDNTTPVTLRIPVISKYSYMIDGYGYDEAMKHDGKGLAQRFWFTPSSAGVSVSSNTYPVETINLYTTSNVNGDFNLSYKNTEKSILTEYFNIQAYLSSNYVEVEVYISPEEYNRLKNGALVHFDSDLHYVVSIEGYDPTSNNKTTLKLMTKVI